MWEYRWAEVTAGSAEDAELSRLGADGWEAVGMTVTGEHFGKTWVKVLLKRPVAARVAPAAPVAAPPAVIDLTEPAPRAF